MNQEYNELYVDKNHSISFYLDDFEEEIYFIVSNVKVGTDHHWDECQECIFTDEICAPLQDVLNKYEVDNYNELKRLFIDIYKYDKLSYDKILTEFKNKGVDFFVENSTKYQDGIND